MLLYEGYPLATHSSSVVCVDTDLVSVFRASIPLILVEVAASVAFLTGWGEGNNSMLGHCDLLLGNDVGGVDGGVGLTFSLSFFFLWLLFLTPHCCFLFLLLDDAGGTCCCCYCCCCCWC